MNRQVIMVTGFAPPEACGVGDYAALLVAGLQKQGVRADLFHLPRWNVAGTWEALRKLIACKDALIHFPYPSLGYGYSLGPQVCATVKACVATIHKFSCAHILRRISIGSFTLRALQIVKITAREKQSRRGGRTHGPNYEFPGRNGQTVSRFPALGRAVQLGKSH